MQSKKGFAIEFSVVFMVLIFLFCSIITSTMTYKKVHNKNLSTSREELTEVDQVGDAFLAAVKNKQNFFEDEAIENDRYNGYPCKCYVGSSKNAEAETLQDTDKIVWYCLHVFKKDMNAADTFNEENLLLDVVVAEVTTDNSYTVNYVANWSDQPLDFEKELLENDGSFGSNIEWETYTQSTWEVLWNKFLKFFQAVKAILQIVGDVLENLPQIVSEFLTDLQS